MCPMCPKSNLREMQTKSSSPRRVVVTGIGLVTPLGLDVESTWTALVEGKSGISTITHFDPNDCPVKIAGEVKHFDVTKPIGPFEPSPGSLVKEAANSKEARRVGRFCHLGLSACLQAYGDSGLDSYRSKIDPTRFGANIGVGMGGLPEIESVHNDYLEKGYRRITPFFIPQAIPSMVSGQISILLNLQGSNLCNVTACTSSAHAIGESFRQIQRGDADLIMAGGAEAVICRLGIGGFAAMRALSTRNDQPTLASRPFDQDRDGFVMGEGAGALVLEEYEHAKKRGAKIYAEVCGYGLSGDAYHMTSPAPEGEGGKRAMIAAIKDAELNTDQIGYVNAHGTSTPTGDAEEAKAIASVFTGAIDSLHVSSTKSMTGHLLGAAGAAEAVFSILAMNRKVIPPTMNLEKLDTECVALKINFTANQAAQKEIQYALSNSFGFGGTNASLIFGKI